MSEIIDVQRRCEKCGMAVVLLVQHRGLTYAGEPYSVIGPERVSHPVADCERMKTLEREQWPTLW